MNKFLSNSSSRKRFAIVALFLPVLAVSFASLPVTALAQFDAPEIPEYKFEGFDSVIALMEEAGRWLFWILIFLSIIFVLIAAYKYLTSSGDPQKVSEATKTIVYAAVAVAVALFAIGFPQLVGSLFGVTIFPGL